MRVGLFLVFFFPGLNKLQQALAGETTGILGMIGGIFGDGLAPILLWALIAAEFLGPIFILAGKLVPKWLYKLSLISLLVVSLVILIKFSDEMSWGTHALITLTVIGLMMDKPKCMMGITGCKGGSCDGDDKPVIIKA